MLGLFAIEPPPEGLDATVRLYRICVKLAVTLFGPFIVTDDGFVDPERSTDQLEKLYPVPAEEETETVWPLLYQFVPEGLRVPPPVGLADVVNEY